MAGAEIVYKNVGQVIDGMTDQPKIIDGTGRLYKIKTDKKGTFLMLGVDFGIYEIEVKAPDGSRIYTGKKRIGDNADPNVSNVLNVDLSGGPAGAVSPGAKRTWRQARNQKSRWS